MKALIAGCMLGTILLGVLAGCAQDRSPTDLTGPSATTAKAVTKAASCPSDGTPGAGAVVQGGIEVNGYCLLDHVTVNDGILVDPGGNVELESSLVSGGIVVSPCSEIEVDLSDHPTGEASTINGDLDATANTDCPSGGFSDLDIWTAQINGKLTISGSYLGGPTVCGNRITGDVVLAHVTSVHPFWLGDPDGAFGCPGNTIGGALSVSNSLAVGAGRTLEVEANRVAGSVLLRASTLELNENTIGGSLLCSDGTLILPREPDDDPVGNTVRGANTCEA
jgi:hypothetical protein